LPGASPFPEEPRRGDAREQHWFDLFGENSEGTDPLSSP
jgi:hypothetical protein